MQYTLFMTLAPLAALTLFVVIFYTWRRRSAPGAVALLWLLVDVTGWLVLSVLQLADPTKAGPLFWAKVAYPFITFVPVAWLVFVFRHTGRDQWFKPVRLALLTIVPIITSCLALTNDLHHLLWATYTFITVNPWLAMSVTYGPWFPIHATYSYTLILLGAFIIGVEYFRAGKLYRQQTVWLILGAVGPIVFNVVYVFRLIRGFTQDYSPIGFALAGLAFAIGMFRYRLFDLKPMARDVLVESMSDGMVVLDEQDRVVDLNQAAEDILGLSIATTIGRPVSQVFSPWQDLGDRFGDKREAQAEISLERGGINRYYDLRISPLTNPQGHFSGRLIVLREITQRKGTEFALRESEEKLRQITSSLREAVWLRDTRTLAILYVNPAYESIWGRTCESLYQNPMSFLDAVHPEDKELLMAAIQKQYQGIPFDQEYRIFRPDGSLRWIRERTFFIKNEAGEAYRVVAVAEDITAHKQAEEILRENESWLRAVTHALPDLVFIFDRDGRYIEVPETFQDLVVRPEKGQLLGSLVHEVLPKDVADSFLSVLHRTMETGQPQSLEYQLDVPRGRRWFEGRTAPMWDSDGKIGHVVWGARDITERKEAEESLRRANLELQARNEELDAFDHTVAHDLRSPLSIVIGYANTIADYADTLSREELQQSARALLQVGLKMDNIIDELMLLAGLRKAQVTMEPLDMAAIVAEAQQRLSRTIDLYHAEIVLPAAWPQVIGYGPWVEGVWANYISNAIKYGGRPPCVELGATLQPDGMVRFWVHDNGPGLTPEAQARLFTPFERLDQVRIGGHGVGLSIVQRIVEKMGGQACAESAGVPGQGCTFSFTLPAARSET
jgi:PAS domain S-box-containing protein